MPAVILTDPIQTLTAEGLISLAEVARRLGNLRGKRPVHPSTIGRWVALGRRLPDGRVVKLEAIRVGGQRITSWPATARYLAEQQTPPVVGEAGTGPGSPAERQKAAVEAGRELESMEC